MWYWNELWSRCCNLSSCCGLFVGTNGTSRRSLVLILVVRMEELEQAKKDYEKALEEGVGDEEEV